MEQDPRRRSLGYLWRKARYEEQERELDETSALWEHIEQVQETLRQIKAGVAFNDPSVKYWQETISKTKEVVVRREHRIYYAFLPSASCQVNLSYGAINIAPATAVSGWQPVSLPDGTKITIQAANASDNIPVLICASNAPIVYPTANSSF